jgi:hypothetical protein
MLFEISRLLAVLTSPAENEENKECQQKIVKSFEI